MKQGDTDSRGKAMRIMKLLIIVLSMISLTFGCSSQEQKSADLFGKYYKLPDKIIIYDRSDKK